MRTVYSRMRPERLLIVNGGEDNCASALAPQTLAQGPRLQEDLKNINSILNRISGSYRTTL